VSHTNDAGGQPQCGSVSPSTWTESGQNPDVLRGLAANSGLDMTVLEPLLGSRDQATLAALAERVDLTDAASTTLARQPSPAVRAALARNPVAAMVAWPVLVDDTDVEVRCALARGHSQYFRPTIDLPLPDPAQWHLAQDADARVRRQLALRRDLSERVGVRLASDVESLVREAIALWPSLPDSVIPALLRDEDPQVRRNVLVWATPPSEMLARLLRDPTTRPDTAGKAQLERTDVSQLLTDADEVVRENLAGNPHVPFDWLLPLADDGDEDVRTALMLRRDLSDDARERIASTVTPRDYHLAWWLTPPHATLEQRLASVTSRFVFCRRAVALSPDLPAWAVARLAADDDESVRLLLAENHADVPGDILPDLIRRGGHAQWELVKHPNMPADALTAFALSDDERLRRVAATGPNLPAADAIALADHPDLTTRLLVAANPAMPPPKLIALLGDPLSAEAAARNPQLPTHLARTLIAAR
jgi:hypothetical protein